jgi:hypothetical protein
LFLAHQALPAFDISGPAIPYQASPAAISELAPLATLPNELILVPGVNVDFKEDERWSDDGSGPLSVIRSGSSSRVGLRDFFHTHAPTHPRNAHVKGELASAVLPHWDLGGSLRTRPRDNRPLNINPLLSNLPPALSDHLDHLITLIVNTPAPRLPRKTASSSSRCLQVNRLG